MSAKFFIGRNGVVALAALALAAVAAAVFYARSPELGKSDTCSEGSEALARKLAPLAHGEMAALQVSPRRPPELAFKSPGGAPLTLADFKGRAVVLNLWATWCVPCRAEMPALDHLQAEAGNKDFEVVAVDVDTARLERVPAFLDSVGVKALTRYADPSGDLLEKLRVAGTALGLPTSVLIDKEGCQLGAVAGAAKWDSEDALAAIKALAGG